jgi:hypothetical protein
MSSIINDTADDSDDDLAVLLGLGPTFARRRMTSPAAPAQAPPPPPALRTAAVTPVAPLLAARGGVLQGVSNNARSRPTDSTARQPPKKKRKTAAQMPHCIIWVCTHGKGQCRRQWRQRDLKIVGIYSTRQAAESAKLVLMQDYECCGHGDILTGGSWEDEIDLVIRPAPLFLDKEDVE